MLLEKPISTAVEEGRQLARLARQNAVVLQVGHLERFNPVIAAIAEDIRAPVFIESTRIAPYRPRSLDVSVILDLMIHDIDLIHSFVATPIEHVDAIGRSIFSNSIDIANARIRFSGGCVATVTSSRISMKTERTLRVFAADTYLSADLQHKTLARYTRRSPGPVAGPEDVAIDNRAFSDSDAMLAQTEAFLLSVAGGAPPLVSGRNATDALETAIAIVDAVNRQDAR